MPRRDEDETTLEGRPRFWNAGRILLVIVFAIGFVLGAFVTNKYIDQSAITVQQADSNSLIAENQRLDQRGDVLHSCLVRYGISPDSCS